MDLGSSTPSVDLGPCWYCRHYAGPCWGDPYLADCRRDPQAPTCSANAAAGCVFFERLPGVDDDGWEPPPKVYKPLKPR
jgi:hypothetical protein